MNAGGLQSELESALGKEVPDVSASESSASLDAGPIGNAPRLLHIFPGFGLGGSQRRFAAIANHFGPTLRHMVWSLDGSMGADRLLRGSSCEIKIGFPRHGVIRNILTARRWLRQLRPDIMFTYNWGSIEWAAANLPPLSAHVHIEDGFGPEEAEKLFARRCWFRRLVLNSKSTVVLPSQTLVRIARDAWRLDSSRLAYIPNGIPCERFGIQADPALVQGFRGEGPVIGTVATLRREKALERLIEAFQIVRQNQRCRLVIAGDGVGRKKLEGVVAALGLDDDVTFTGMISQPERILGAFDVFALSSDTEQMPLSIIEAMAAGLPLATTDAGDIPNMVAAENAPFVVEKSSRALAGAIQKLIVDAALRARLGRANRRKALAQFDEADMFAAYGALISRSLSPAARSASVRALG